MTTSQLNYNTKWEDEELQGWVSFYTHNNFSIIPLKHRAKEPEIPEWRPYQQRRPSPEELLRWFSEGKHNIAIICGRVSDNLVVLDFDSPVSFGEANSKFKVAHNLEFYQATFVVKTNRGWHVYFRFKELPPSRKLPQVDIQAEGKYVVAPPSIHPSGTLYEPISEEYVIAEFDRFEDLGLGIKLQEERAPLSLPTKVKEGERNTTLFRLACSLRSKGVTEEAIRAAVHATNTEQCDPPLPEKEVESLIKSALRYPPREEETEEIAELPEEEEWLVPKLPEEVWTGVFKLYRDTFKNTTEAPDSYHFAVCALVFGATLKRSCFVYHARPVYPNFYIALVGRTGISRKDTAWARGRKVLTDLHAEDLESENRSFDIIQGVGSAEGLLDALAGEDKAVVLAEMELASLLMKARQEGLGNLIPKLTSLWDCPDLETLKTRNKPVVCKRPFLALYSGTTLQWLHKALTERDIWGGFANRFCYVVGTPKDPMAFPEKPDEHAYQNLLRTLNDIRMFAQREIKGEVTVTNGAQEMFRKFYDDFYKRCQEETLSSALVPRIQTFLWKLALLYAIGDYRRVINEEDVERAIAGATFFEQSARVVFAEFTENSPAGKETRLLNLLQEAKKPVPKRTCYRRLKCSARELDTLAESLCRLGLVREVFINPDGGGRKIPCLALS